MLAIIIGGTLLTLGVITARIVYNTVWTSKAILQKEQAYWLAAGGMEMAEVNLEKNPAWFTDLPLSGNVKNWLAGAAIGDEVAIGEGTVKIVREREGRMVYTVGSRLSGKVFLSGEIVDGSIKNRKEI